MMFAAVLSIATGVGGCEWPISDREVHTDVALCNCSNIGFFLVHLLDFSLHAPLTGTLVETAGEIAFTNISARDINASFCVFHSVTSGLAGDGFCSS